MLKKIAALGVGLWLSIGVCFAQTSPNLTYGQVLTPAQWNQLFINKQDTLGFTPLNLSGGVMSGRLVTAAPSSTTSGFNTTPGTAPASPVNGDWWVTTAGAFVQVNGVTIGPIGGATSSSFAATSPITLSFPSGVVTYACATCGVTGSPLSQFAATTSAQLLGVISDETGTGLIMGNNGPTMIAPILGAATATSINKVAITAPATSATLTIANGKTLTANNSLTFTGTDSTSFAFPGTSDTVATLAATQTLTNKTITSSTDVLGGVTMTLGSDATGDIYYRSGGVLTRIGIGSTSNVLTVSGGIPAWLPGSAAASVTVGTTTITSGTTLNLLYNNAGVLGNLTLASILTAPSSADLTITGTTSLSITQNFDSPVLEVDSGLGTTVANNTMMGWGVTSCRITPKYSSRVWVEATAVIAETATTSFTVALRFGTGTGPSQGAAATGTQIGTQAFVNGAATMSVPAKVGGIITGLTPGTAIWIDGLVTFTPGDGSISNVGCRAHEIL